MKKYLIVLLLLYSCATTSYWYNLTPEDCRKHNVAVLNNAVNNGKIVKIVKTYPQAVAAKCRGAEGGCARAANKKPYLFPSIEGKYEIWYSNDDVFLEEVCHAVFNEARHVF